MAVAHAEMTVVILEMGTFTLEMGRNCTEMNIVSLEMASDCTEINTVVLEIRSVTLEIRFGSLEMKVNFSPTQSIGQTVGLEGSATGNKIKTVCHVCNY